ncbi:MAG: S9 family peptidase, partial [Ktedonobacteraceae bacterium]|nr:S9 family peptidase [Ktedonobacteraceae bacterium]
MSTTATRLIPRDVLFGNPVKTSPQISPDGKRMAYLAPVNGVLNVWVGNVGSDDYQPVTSDTDRGVRFYSWAADNLHIIYIQDVGGNENWRLYATNLETRETRDLTPFENVQVRVVKHDKRFPNDLLIAMNKENVQLHDVYHLDLASGELSLIAKNPGNFASWVPDRQFKVRAGLAALPDGGHDLLVRDDEQGEWRKLLTWNADDALTSGPLDFTADGESLYLEDSRDVNAGRLVRLHVTSGNLDVIAEDPQYDVGSVMIHPDTY